MNFNEKKLINYIFTILCLFIFLFSAGKIMFWVIDNVRTEKLQKEAMENVKEKSSSKDKTQNINPSKSQDDDYWSYINQDMLNVDFDELSKINSDTVGWVKLNGSNIDYPVVQTNNNDFYLHHSYDKSKNNAGWVFLDFRNNVNDFDKNTIIYGHGRLDNTMFGSLKDILKQEWQGDKNNYVVKFSTPKYSTLWQVFSVYSTEAEDYYITTNFDSEGQYNEFLTVIKNRSIKNFNTNLNTEDKIITLSTCKDAFGKERIVLHAKLIKIENKE